MSITTLKRDNSKIEELRLSLIDKGFYWIKWNKDADFEVARWNKELDRFKFTNGSFQRLMDVYEIDTKVLKHK